MSSTRILLLILITGLCFQGCVIKRKTETVRDSLDAEKKTLIPSDIIEKRIKKNLDLFGKEGIPEDKKELALSLIEIYNKMRILDPDNTGGPESREVIKGLFEKIGLMEKNYLYLFDSSDLEIKRSIIDDYLHLKQKISENYLIGNYNDVITQCAELESKYGNESLTPEISLFLALSLAQENMAQEALSIGKRIIKGMELNPDLILLTANVIEWELESGSRKNALGYFEKLLDNINEKNALFKKTENLLSKDEDNDLDKLSDRPISETYQSVDGVAEANLKRVEKLISEGNFAEARLLLLRWRMRAEEGPEMGLIEQALKSVDAAEDSLKKGDSIDKIKLNEARNLLDNEKYEDAINMLESIKNEDLDPEINKVKKIAVEKLINKKALEAGNLFQKGLKSNNIENKRAFFRTSKAILEQLIETYPGSALIEKLKGHLGKVTDELEKLP
ncbi:tol-pal system YbgF family protein [Thermodesulfobacteriota bacterium]